MALDPNINRIKFLRSTTVGSTPAVSLIEDGELAFNLADRTIYSKNGPNIVELGFGKGGTVSGAITAPAFNGPLNGNASTATKLQTIRSISLTGSATGTTTFDGSTNASMAINVNLVDSAIAYSKKGTDLPSTYGTGVQGTFVRSTDGFPMAYAGLLTFKPYIESNGGTLQFLSSYGSAFSNNQVMIRLGDHGTSDWTTWRTLVTSENVGTYAPTLTGVGASGSWNINSATTTQLQTTRNIGITGSGASGTISFNGTTNVNIPLVVATQPTITNNTTIATTAFVQAVNSSDTGSAATAVKLKTSRTINSVAFDGTSDIVLPGVKAFANFDGVLNTFRKSNGISNIDNQGQGRYLVTLAQPAPDANYVVQATAAWGASEAASANVDYEFFTPTASQFVLRCAYGGDNTRGTFNSKYLNITVYY